ncbi:DUF397 domain-containing protein [Streptomyces sp. NPDC005576]|uniref:DUF397 domain-containing protein n=1 Tax=unclassified Streptomyces TaxID=2593676 RepID=UPI0033F04AE4
MGCVYGPQVLSIAHRRQRKGDEQVKPDQFSKSSYSGGNAGQECVEVAHNGPDSVAIRDSKGPGGPVIVVSLAAWAAFGADLGRSEVRPSR